MRNSTRPSMTTWPRPTLAIALALGLVSLGVRPAPQGSVQERARLNRVIEALEEGRPAVANQAWRFIDMEHAPFSAERLESILGRDGQGQGRQRRLNLAPLVRIPQEGDEDFKWAVKQVLDLGAFGVVLPHVDTKEEAIRLVRAMRYPPMRNLAAARAARRAGVGAWEGGPFLGRGERQGIPQQGRRLAPQS